MAAKIIRPCEYCGNLFHPHRNTPKYKHCSRHCADEHKKARWKERFFSRIEVRGPNDCWMWRGGRTKKGYGAMRKHGRQCDAHRIAYETACGPIPDGLLIRHTCDTPPCVNPRHLKIGTVADNVRDRDERQRTARGEQSGMAITNAETVRAIRNERSTGRSLKTLAAKYDISINTIAAIVYRKTWKHID